MALAITEPTAAVADTSNTTSYALGAFTPAANAILAVWALTAAAAIDGTMAGGSLTWAHKLRVNFDGTSKDLRLFWAYSGASPASCTPTFDCTGDAANGAILSIVQITGANVSLVDPWRQITSATGTASSNPTCAFGASMDTLNAYVSAFGCNLSGAPGGTQPTSWTRPVDVTMLTPNMGQDAAYRVNGETGTSVAWTLAGTFSWAIIAAEVYRAGAGPTGSQLATMMAMNGG